LFVFIAEFSKLLKTLPTPMTSHKIESIAKQWYITNYGTPPSATGLAMLTGFATSLLKESDAELTALLQDIDENS
jgi:hypothetical protein